MRAPLPWLHFLRSQAFSPPLSPSIPAQALREIIMTILPSVEAEIRSGRASGALRSRAVGLGSTRAGPSPRCFRGRGPRSSLWVSWGRNRDAGVRLRRRTRALLPRTADNQPWPGSGTWSVLRRRIWPCGSKTLWGVDGVCALSSEGKRNPLSP